MLRSAEASIGDDGFSDRVLARLPKRRRRFSTVRRATLAAAAGVGSLATILLAPPVESLLDGLALFGGSWSAALTAAAIVAILAGPAVWFFYFDPGE